MSKNKAHISLLFLAIFCCIRLAGLHELSHSENEEVEECKLCEFVITTDTVPFLASKTITFEPLAKHIFIRTLSFNYSYQFEQTQIDKSLFCRPPPTV